MYRVIFGEGNSSSNSALQVWDGASLAPIVGLPFQYANSAAPAFPTAILPQSLATYGNAVYFMAPTLSAPYLALFKSDGVTANLASSVGLPSGMVSNGKALYFSGYVGAPTPQTTAIVAFDGKATTVTVQFNDYGNMQPAFLTPFNDGLAFTADDGTTGREPWFWDGKTAATIGDINAGLASSNASYFTPLNNKLYFAADDGTHGRQLWVWDGTKASMAADLADVAGGSNPIYLTALNGAIYFSANSGTVVATNGPYVTYASGLWRWDGQSASIVSAFGAYSPSELTVVGNKLYFVVNDGIHGGELWLWDGSKAALVVDIAPGPASSNPHSLKEVGGNLYFFANDGSHGVQPWLFDGTSATMLGTLSPSGSWGSASGSMIAGFGHPTVSGISFSLGLSGSLDATVAFDAQVQVQGVPTMQIAINGQTVQAAYAGGSGGKSLVFETAHGTIATASVTVNPTSLSVNTGSVVDQDGNAADLTFAVTSTQIYVSAPSITSATTQSILSAPVANTAVLGSGLDVINMGGKSSSAYALTTSGDGSFSISTSGSTNHIAGVMQVQFSDKTVTFAQANSLNAQTALLYQGALARTPDPSGLAYWDKTTSVLPPSSKILGVYGLSDTSGGYNGSLSIAAGFTSSVEFISKYGNLSNAQFVTQLYANVLDRQPDAGGLSYWQAQLTSGTTRDHVLVGFAESSEALTNATVGFTGQSGVHVPWLFLT